MLRGRPAVVPRQPGWSEAQIARFLEDYPNRAYLPRLARLASGSSNSVGVEVGVADGRFSELALLDMLPHQWFMIEPFPNARLKARLDLNCTAGNKRRASCSPEIRPWSQRGIGHRTKLRFLRGFSVDTNVLGAIPDASVDFIYLDGAHAYKMVKQELHLYWPKVRPGGMLAGHDYCDYGELPLSCKGCAPVPACLPYTAFGVARGKPAGRRAGNQHGVVRAVQEWLVETHPELTLRHTQETFTHESLDADGLPFDLVTTATLNPSWLVIKPNEEARPERPCGVGQLQPRWGGTEACGSSWLQQKQRDIAGSRLIQVPSCRTTSALSIGQEAKKDRSGITLVILSYASPALVVNHLETIRSYSKQTRRALDVLVIDDGSPPGLDAAPFVTPRHAEGLHSLKVVAIAEDLAWNIGGARNLAFHLAATTRVLLLDADTVLSPEMIEATMALPHHTSLGNHSTPVMHKFNRRRPSGELKPHPAAMLIGTAQYWQTGACDEDFVGHYGYTDVHFTHRARHMRKAGRLVAQRNTHIVLKEVASMAPCDPAVLPRNGTLQHSCRVAASVLGSELSRDARPNQRLFEHKLRTGCWSNSYLRFSWAVAARFPL